MLGSWRVLAIMWGATVLAMVGLWAGSQLGPAPPPALRRHSPASQALLAPADVPPVIPAGPARMFRGDSRHTGRSPFRGPTRPELRWTYDAGARISGQAVTDAQQRVYVAAHDGALHVLTGDGKLRDRRDLGAPEPSFATPLLDERGRLYVGSDAGALWGFDRAGASRFQLRTAGPVDGGSVPCSDGLVCFTAGRFLYAVTPEGRPRWRFEARGKLYTTPARTFSGRLLAGSQDDHVYAVGRGGRLCWRYRAGGDVDSSPVVGDDGTVFVGADDGRVHALDPSGARRWVRALGGYIRAPLALGLKGEVYAHVYGPRPALVALSARDGEVRWRFELGKLDSAEVGSRSGPLVDADGQLYVGTHDGRMVSLTPQGRLRWSFETAGRVDASPLLRADGTLIFGSEDGHLYALAATR